MEPSFLFFTSKFWIQFVIHNRSYEGIDVNWPRDSIFDKVGLIKVFKQKIF